MTSDPPLTTTPDWTFVPAGRIFYQEFRSAEVQEFRQYILRSEDKTALHFQCVATKNGMALLACPNMEQLSQQDEWKQHTIS